MTRIWFENRQNVFIAFEKNTVFLGEDKVSLGEKNAFLYKETLSEEEKREYRKKIYGSIIREV